MLLGRPIDAVRLCVLTPTLADLTQYLAHVGWQDPAERLVPVVRPLFELTDEVCVDVDIGEGVFPRIGVECRYRDSAQPAKNETTSLKA